MYTILITAIGKRVQLIKHLKKKFKVVGVDLGVNNPALSFVDKFYQVPKFDTDNYVNALMDICKCEGVKLIIPLYEKEFDILIAHREKFNNKINTYQFFKANHIKTPKSYSKDDLVICKELDFPMIIKPIDGMGSQSVFKIKNKYELDFFSNYVSNPIIQEFIEGIEYTVDVLCDFSGNIISIVPRERIEVRSGEVSKSKTVKDYNIINASKDVINKLNQQGTVIGPMTVQCIVDGSNSIYFIEINPRFGGGVPLAFEAGIDYGYYLLEMLNGNDIKGIIGKFRELTMLRYDEAIYRN
jgi:carbamoyl-phosphate synthase large subunit